MGYWSPIMLLEMAKGRVVFHWRTRSDFRDDGKWLVGTCGAMSMSGKVPNARGHEFLDGLD
jgi:hypothetical protein